MKALLLSGGLDSSAIAYWQRPQVCITVDYGQLAAAGEIAASKHICNALRLPHHTIKANLSAIGSGEMSGGPTVDAAKAPEFWPYRNQLLITLAAMALIPQGLKEISIGAVSTDVHSDGQPGFIKKIDEIMRLQEGHIRVVAPAARMSSKQLLERSKFPKRFIGLTFSCHVNDYACGQCNGCTKHREIVDAVYGFGEKLSKRRKRQNGRQYK